MGKKKSETVKRLDRMEAQFAAGLAATVERETGVEVEAVVEQRSFSRYYDYVIDDGKVIKTGHDRTTTKRTLWKRPKRKADA